MESYGVIVPLGLDYKFEEGGEVYYPAKITNSERSGYVGIQFFLEDGLGESLKKSGDEINAKYLGYDKDSVLGESFTKVFLERGLARRIFEGKGFRKKDRNFVKRVSEVPDCEKYFDIFELGINRNRPIRNSRGYLFYQLQKGA